MSRVLQFRSLIREVITRNLRSREERTLTAFASSNDPCLIFHRKCSDRQLLLKDGPKLLESMSSNFHTSVNCQSDEPRQASSTSENTEDSHQSPSHDLEEFQDGNYGNAATSDVGDSRGGHQGEGSSIIDRLRRLSMTPAEEYELSPMAQEKAQEMHQVRKEAMQKGEQWKWDQRNLRPSGPPQQRYGGGGYNNKREGGYGMRRNRYGEEEDWESERGWDSQDNFSDRRSFRGSQDNFSDRRSFRGHQDRFVDRRGESSFSRMNSSRFEDEHDEPENYEMEMEKLRERLHQNKAKKAAVSSKPPSEDLGNERNNDRHISSSSDHTFYKTASSASLSATKSILPERNYEELADSNSYVQHSQDHQVDFTLAEGDPDTFGNLSFATSNIVKDSVSLEIRKELLEEEKKLAFAEEEEEEDDARFVPPTGERWTTDKLIAKVRGLLREKKLTEAVDTYLGVLKQGGFNFEDQPLTHHFHVLINECADAGYVEMAFRLFNLMKKRGYKEKMRTLSSLFNACANSPWDKENNLDRIEKLLINMKDRGKEHNLITYHALIKAYGRLGETVRAFHVVDKMIEESKIKPETATFNMLLQACISDTKNGFRYALITWRKMQSMKRIRPDIYSYNLLIRAIRDCGIELQEINVDGILEASKLQQITAPLPQLEPIVTQEDSDRLLSILIPQSPTSQETQIVLDNLGDPAIVDVKSFIRALSFAPNRLAVFGGVRGMISHMVNHRVAPNLKTVTMLMHLSRAADISDIMQLLNTYKIKPERQFFNTAIKQCYHLDRPKLAENIIKEMSAQNLVPDITTWGVLAGGCRSWVEAKTVLTEMDNTKFTPNIIVLLSSLAAAIKHCDPRYVVHLMEEAKRREITVSENFLLKIDNFIKATQKDLVRHEMGKKVESTALTVALENNPNFGEHFGLLKMRYNTWIQSVDVKVSPENPWKADFEHFKAHRRHKSHEYDDHRYESMISAKNGV